jgi:hypothetical protein
LKVIFNYARRALVRRTLVLVGALALALPGCAVVKPHQREHLAARSMESPFAQPGVADHRDKVVQTRTGGGLPGATVGGGCGCTQ